MKTKSEKHSVDCYEVTCCLLIAGAFVSTSDAIETMLYYMWKA